MNPQLPDTFKVPYAVFEKDGDGNVAAPSPGDTCVVASSDTAKATVVPDAEPTNPAAVQTGFVVGGSTEGTVTISTTINHADGTPGPAVPPTDFDIVSGPATTATTEFGTPVAQ